jgi:hypothetical protein
MPLQHPSDGVNYLHPTVVSVAQLVEHRSVAPRVAGSNPVAHPSSLSNLASWQIPSDAR